MNYNHEYNLAHEYVVLDTTIKTLNHELKLYESEKSPFKLSPTWCQYTQSLITKGNTRMRNIKRQMFKLGIKVTKLDQPGPGGSVKFEAWCRGTCIPMSYIPRALYNQVADMTNVLMDRDVDGEHCLLSDV